MVFAQCHTYVAEVGSPLPKPASSWPPAAGDAIRRPGRVAVSQKITGDGINYSWLGYHGNSPYIIIYIIYIYIQYTYTTYFNIPSTVSG